MKLVAIAILVAALGPQASGGGIGNSETNEGDVTPDPNTASAEAGPDLFTTEGTSVVFQGTATPGVGWSSLWTDSMDTYPAGSISTPWTDEAVPPSTATISSSTFHGTSGNSLRLYDPDTTSAGLASRSLGYDRVDVRVWALTTVTTGWSTLILRSDTAWSAVRAGFGGNGVFLYDGCPSSFGIDSPVAYLANVWYELRIVADATTDTYDFYVNGTTIASGRPLCSPSTSFTDIVPCSAGSFISTSYWDDFAVDVLQPLPITEYRWDYNSAVDSDGDGNFTNDADALTPSATAVYGDNGDYLVTLTVTDTSAAQASDSLIVHVSNVPPQLNASAASPVSVTRGVNLSLQAQDPGSDDLTLDWYWDDGATATVTYLNGVGPDPPLSPEGTSPFLVSNASHHDFPGAGLHRVIINVTDDDGDMVSTTIDVDVKDTPLTALGVGVPSFAGATTYINESTSLGLSPTDRSASGINSSYYQVDGGSPIMYSAPFVLRSPGLHNVSFWSMDNLGGNGTPESMLLYVDNGPPTTNLTVSGVFFQLGDDMWILPSSTLSFQATDTGSGVAESWVRTWDGVGWSSWGPAPAFLVPPVAFGSFSVEIYSVDRLDQPEDPTAASFIVDGAPPVSSLQAGEPKSSDWVTNTTPLTILATDLGVGVRQLSYRWWHAGAWSPWMVTTDTVSLRLNAGGGLYYVEYSGIDNLGNAEPVNNQSLRVDTSPPALSVRVDYSETDYELTVSVVASDDGVGLSSVQYRVDGGQWTDYTSPLTVRGKAPSAIEFRATDSLGNSMSRGPEVLAPRYTNLKPLLSAVLALVLGVLGALLVRRRSRRKVAIAVLGGFVLLEVAVGVVSYATDFLRVPPWLGAGSIANLAITVVGIAVMATLTRPGRSSESALNPTQNPTPQEEPIPPTPPPA